MPRRRETPIRRVNPSGKVVWLARWTDKTGQRHYGMPPEIPGTYPKKGPCREGGKTCCAQHAIEACYELDEHGPVRRDTVGGYFATWTKQRPRSKVTNRTNTYRINAVLDVKVEGVALRDWPLDQLRRRHTQALVDHMLREQGRAYSGVMGVLGSLSAMAEDAIDDEVMAANPFRGVKVRKNDPRIQRERTPVRVFSWQEMHAFARACADARGGGRGIDEWRAVYAEPMVRCLSDLGLRAGELLPLERRDVSFTDGTLEVRRTVALGEVLPGTKTDHGEQDAGRVVPVPPDLLRMLDGMPRRIDTPLLFPTPMGRLWGYQNWWRLVWEAGREVSGMDVRPHEMRHSWVSLMRAAGLNPADLAEMAGHTEQTATARYSHALGRSFDQARKAVGQ